MRLTAPVVFMAALAMLLAAGLAFAIPPVINYQGKLVDSAGDPVNDSVDITFTIYNAPTGGDVLWTETQTVGVVNGIFNVYLGSIEEIFVSTFDTDIVYLGIQVAGNAEMTPRQLYSAAPFAFRAHSADMVAEGAVTSAMIENGTILGEDIATDTITSNEIATGAVTTSEIADGAITDTDIDANASISASKINRTDLNADLLDGKDYLDFAASAHQHSGGDITDGTITGNAIAADTITAGNIATGGVGTSEILDNSIGSIDIADGTITGADISAVAAISASKIDRTGLDADLFDGEDSAVFSRKYKKVAVVALEGGDYTSPVAAANDYLTWCGTPSMTNPCLIKVMPGIYDIGPDTVVLQPLLNIEGSGINSTAILGKVSSNSAGVINGAATSEIKHLTVQNKGGGTTAVAIYNNGSGDSLRIYDVRATSEWATDCYTIFNDDGASAEIRTVTAFANCTSQNIAIFSDTGSEISIENTNIEVWEGNNDAYGIEFVNSSSFMSNVRIEASSNGTTTVSGVYFKNSATGEMHNVIAEASGGLPKGVLIEQNSDVTMRNVTVKASDPASGVDTSGINISLSNVDMEGVSIEATSSRATDYVRGLYADVSTSGSLNIKGLRVTASGGADCYGIHAINSSGGYIPMSDVQIWSFCDVARGILALSGDFGMKNLEAYGSSGSSGGSGTGISLYDAYAGMQGVEALGNGSNGTNYGIFVNDSDIEGVDVRAQGESDNGDSAYNYGVFVTSTANSTVRITGGQIKAYGGAYGYAVYLTGISSSSVELTGVKVQANATEATGINGDGTSGSITVDSSRIEVDAPFYTVYTGSGYSTTIGSTRLRGVKPTTSGGSTFSCASSYHDMGGSLVGATPDCQ